MPWPSLHPRTTESISRYAGVLVPLEEAHLHSYSARCGRTEYEEISSFDDGNGQDGRDGEDGAFAKAEGGRGEGDNGDGDDGDQGEDGGMLEMRAAEYSVDGLRRQVRMGRSGSGRGWSEYELKSKLINKAIQDIGMGRYNWQLFVLCGFGWFADNVWMQGISLTLPSLSSEFAISEKSVRYTTSSLYVGLCLGSFLWGIGSDVLGRRIAFNVTLLITATFGILISYAPSWPSVCFLWACLGFGVGGNLPVDGALFLEFLPDASSSLLTLLSVWWPIGQLFSSIVAWWCIPRYATAGEGWRWFVFILGLVTLGMFCIRFFVFHLFESPKFLLSKGRQAEAVAVVHGLAWRNGAKTWLTEDILNAVADGARGGDSDVQGARHGVVLPTPTKILTSKLESFSASRLQPLFNTRQLGIATMLIWIIWATIGMGYPLFNAFLPQYLAHTGQDDTVNSSRRSEISTSTYREYVIFSIAGVPGSILAYYAVDSPSALLGRRGTLAISTFVSATFLFLFAALGHDSPRLQLFFSCIEAFAQNIMYGVLYAFTPEIFPAPVRGAGTGVASFLNRATGLMAPVLAANVPGDGTTVPIYMSGGLILAAFVAMVLIPIETRGRQRL